MKNTFVENSKKLSDEALIKKINAGEYQLLRVLFSRYTPLIHYHASAHSSDENDFEDLVQDGLIALYSAVKGYKSQKASFSTFATLCIKRALIDENRAALRKKRIPAEACSSLNEVPDLVKTKSAENEFIERESLKDLTDTIRVELSDFEYKVLLGFLSGSTYCEIATANGVSAKSVDNALKRVRTKLKNKKDV